MLNKIIGVILMLGVLSSPVSAQHAHHEHHAPHGGTLVVLGEEFAHLEFVLDLENGKLTAYALDGEAENPVRLSQDIIELTVVSIAPQQGQAMDVVLEPVANDLTGETVGDTSQYEADAPLLTTMTVFNARIKSIDIKGETFKDVEFNFPEGNEHN